MRRFFAFLLSAIFVSAISCTKTESDDAVRIPNGREVEIMLETGRGDDVSDDSKLSLGAIDTVTKNIPAFWNQGDAVRIFSCLPESSYSYDEEAKKIMPTKEVTDCGDFVTQQESVSKAWFKGILPEAGNLDEGLALFPSDLYVEGSAKISGTTKQNVSSIMNIPATQDGTGYRYIVAASRFRGGAFQKFYFVTNLIKINVPAGLGVTKIELSCPSTYSKGICSKVNVYYYFTESATASCTTSSTSNTSKTLTVYNDGKELSGDIYFATRNIDSGTELSLVFYKGIQVSRTYKYKLTKSHSGGRLLDLSKTPLVPQFNELTEIKFSMDSSAKFVPVGGSEGEKFPYNTETTPFSPYVISNGIKNLDINWYQQERQYAYGDWNWTFGTMQTVAFQNRGMYYYTNQEATGLKMEYLSYLKTPVVPSKKLIGMEIGIGNANSAIWWKMTRDKEAQSPLSGTKSITMNRDEKKSFLFTDTEEDSTYFIHSASGALQLSTLTLYYQ